MNERTLNRPRNIKKRLQCSGIELGEEELCDMDDRMNMRCLIRSRNFGIGGFPTHSPNISIPLSIGQHPCCNKPEIHSINMYVLYKTQSG